MCLTKKNCLLFVNLYIITSGHTLALTWPRKIKKMSNLFKNEFCCIIKKMCAVLMRMLEYISGTYDGVVPFNPYMLKYIPDHLMKQEMCDTAVCRKPKSLQYLPD